MTVSDQQARPPDNPPPGLEWKAIPGAPGYEASHRGKIRSFKKSPEGQELSIRLQNRTRDDDTVYAVGDVRREDGSKWTDTIHSFVLRAHDRAPGPREECRHGPGGPLDNRWPENIRWGTKAENEADKPRMVREPKPPRLCMNECGREAVPHGRRCEVCRAELGRSAAVMFMNGADPDQVASSLNYGSGNGAYRLAVTYGGLRMYIEEAAVTFGHGEGKSSKATAIITQRHQHPPSWGLRSVINRWRASRRNSDAQ